MTEMNCLRWQKDERPEQQLTKLPLCNAFTEADNAVIAREFGWGMETVTIRPTVRMFRSDFRPRWLVCGHTTLNTLLPSRLWSEHRGEAEIL